MKKRYLNLNGCERNEGSLSWSTIIVRCKVVDYNTLEEIVPGHNERAKIWRLPLFLN